MTDENLEELLAEWDIDTSDQPEGASTDDRHVGTLHSLTAQSSLDLLTRFSITGKSSEMRQQMLDDVFVLLFLAILGQWTVFYASPNVGKTLLTLWLLRESIESGDIDGEMVFYVNADDGYRGVVEKTELAEDWGMHILAPNQNGFKSNDIVELMQSFAEDGSAKGVVIILDTLKKFTNLMDKRVASEFGDISRQFVSAGGTLICLAHTNKHKDGEGNPVYSGTSDIVDDADCAYIIDRVSVDNSNDVTIEFANIKQRGDVADTQGFTYRRQKSQSYQELLDTVKRIDREQVEIARLQIEEQKKLDDDAEIISAVCNAIEGGTTSKDKLVKAVKDTTGIGVRQVRKVLDERTGTFYAMGDRWTCSTGKHNKQTYAVLAADDTLPSKN